MLLKLFAPVDGEIKNIENCQDKMFADRMLGDGFVIIPTNNAFKSCFDNAKVKMVFDTKHAFGFDVNGLSFLIHCGLETVSLQGEGFKTNLKPGDIVKKGQDIFSVDLKLLKSKGISSETPIVFEINELKSYTIKNLVIGQVKQGQEICQIEYSITEDLNKVVDNMDISEFFNISNQYEKTAKEINTLVGGKTNYEDVYNCMTRLRFSIKDKEKVQIDLIKKIDIVKGAIWNGTELQVIIGQEVYKVKDEVTRLNTSNQVSNESANFKTKQQVSLIKRFLLMFSGIMVPIIPCIVGAGLIQAITAILTQTGVMPNIVLKNPSNGSILLGEAPIGWIILYIMGKTSTLFSGVIIATSASKYFKYDTVIGTMIGVILCSPLIFVDGGPLGIGNEFIIFKFANIKTGNPLLDQITEVKVNMMNTKIFVVIGAIYTAKHLDTWLRAKLPVALDLMLRTFITVMVVAPLSFFGYGILWNFVEVLFGATMLYIGQIPFGIGVGIFVAIWQVAVIFGVHLVLSLITFLDFMTNGGQSTFGFAASISVWAQIGALIGVIIVTQNAKLKKQAIGMIPAGILGITEPILYSINLPKKRPLISGVIAAFVAGALATIMGVTKRAMTGIGIFEAIGYFSEPSLGAQGVLSPITNGMFYLIACFVAISLAIVLSMLSYKERMDEKTLLNKLFDKVVILIKTEVSNFDNSKELKKQLKEISNTLDLETIKFIKLSEKQIQKYLKNEEKIVSLKEKEKALKSALISKGKKMVENNKFDQATILMNKYNAIDNKVQIEMLEKTSKTLYSEINFEKISSLIDKLENEIVLKLDSIDVIDKELIKEIKPLIFNSLNSLLIYYGMNEQKVANIDLSQRIEAAKLKIKNDRKQVKINA